MGLWGTECGPRAVGMDAGSPWAPGTPLRDEGCLPWVREGEGALPSTGIAVVRLFPTRQLRSLCPVMLQQVGAEQWQLPAL